MTICATTSRIRQKQHKGKKNLFDFDSCLRLYVLDVACSVDGPSVYFAYRLCLKKNKKQNMYRFICMLTVKKYACTIVLFFTQCKNNKSYVMVLWLYTGCVEILCKLCCKKNQLFPPPSLKNKY